MELLFITPSYKPAYVYGGPIVSVSELAETLVANGHTVTVYTTTANGKEELDVTAKQPVVLNGVVVYYFQRQTGDHTHVSKGLWKTLWRTAKQFDVIHLQSWWSVLIFGAAFICRLKKRPYVVSPRGMLSQYSFSHQHGLSKRILHRLWGKSLLKNSILHATTQFEWNDCRAVLPSWEGFVLPNIVRFPTNGSSESLLAMDSNRVLTLGFLSRIDPKKGLELLFEALSGIENDYLFRIAGSGSEEYIAHLKELAIELKISEKLEWCGWVGGEEKFAFLRSIDVFALTSHNENFANVVVESLVVGTPVLVSEGVGLSEFVKLNNLGWVCEMQASSIVLCLNQIFRQRGKIRQIGKRATKIARRDFDKQRVSVQYIQAYEHYC